MSNRRKAKQPRGPHEGLRLLAGQGTGESPRRGELHAVGAQAIVGDELVAKRKLPALPGTAASSIHAVTVSLHGAAPSLWRRLELPSAITLDRLHEVLQLTFDWSGFGPHSFQTPYGEFGGRVRPASRAARRAAERRDGSAVALAQAAGEEGARIVYLYGYDDEWQVDITVGWIRPAAPGVAYPRCTGGQGEDTPGEGYNGIREFDAERAEFEADFGPDIDFDPEELTDYLSDLATVITPKS
jgi:pRiA4b ORF-3-like protein